METVDVRQIFLPGNTDPVEWFHDPLAEARADSPVGRVLGIFSVRSGNSVRKNGVEFGGRAVAEAADYAFGSIRPTDCEPHRLSFPERHP